ncbi:MAG TPA: ice-binding family protein [Streptosporangiaceae bacterium]|nr:ice-binding family protein [Streptosporangiaceae bacterium]
MKTNVTGPRRKHLPGLMTMMLAGVFLVSSAFALTTAGASVAGLASQPAPVSLGTASSFAVLAGSTVTNTGPSVITGDLGVSPGTAVTGFPPGMVVSGTIHAGDAVAAAAQADLTTAYNDAAGRAPDQDLTGQDLGGKTLTAGVYKFDSSAGLTGTLTLDGQGNPDAVFIFQIGSTLTTASASNVVLINGARACDAFWQIGSSATLGTGTSFIGNILALTSITATTGVTVDGRLLARNGAVTLDTNTVQRAGCTHAKPSITVSKTASPASRPAPGGSFRFTVTVHNTSTEAVTLTSLTDNVYGDLNGNGTCATGGTIAAGQSYTCAFSGQFLGKAGDSQTDTVTAVVTDSRNQTASASGSATVTLTKPAPSGYIEICKQAAGPGVKGIFTFTVGSHTVHVPVGACSPLIRVPSGRAVITELRRAPDYLASCRTVPSSRLINCNRSAQTATVAVKAGSSAQQTVVIFTNRVPAGEVKVCKVAGAGVRIGTRIHFTVNRHAITVPAGPAPGGYCVLAGRFLLGTQVTITEQIPAAEHVSAITASPAKRLVSADLTTGTAVVDAGKGFTDVTFTDTTP